MIRKIALLVRKTVRGVKTFTEPKEEKLFSKKEFKLTEKPIKNLVNLKRVNLSILEINTKKGELKFGKKPFNKFDKDEDKAKSFVQKRRLDKLSKSENKETIRLNKYIANSGICSRREADDLITQGLVEVNGKVVSELDTKCRKRIE